MLPFKERVIIGKKHYLPQFAVGAVTGKGF